MSIQLREIDKCEVCNNVALTPVLDLGLHPLCDDLVTIGDSRTCREYPIVILFCERCRTAHQRFQVPKQELFPSTYHYRSRFTADVLKGMAGLVDSCEQRFGKLKGRRVLDIGCNDGSLLNCFRAKGASTIGIEPTAASREAGDEGHVIYDEFLSERAADELVASHGAPDFITFTNVFAHIENLDEVLKSLRHIIAPHTVMIIENHYLGSILHGNQFDTFYHEHPRTYSYTSFLYIARSLDMRLCDVEFPSRYGGNIRVFLSGAAQHQETGDSIRQLTDREGEFLERFDCLRLTVNRWRERKKAVLSELVQQHGALCAKAFPGRAAILVKLLGLNQNSISAVYEKPGSMKIGHYVPGTRVPILSDDDLFARPELTRPLVNFAWHIPREIRDYLVQHGYSGPVIDIVSDTDLQSTECT